MTINQLFGSLLMKGRRRLITRVGLLELPVGSCKQIFARSCILQPINNFCMKCWQHSNENLFIQPKMSVSLTLEKSSLLSSMPLITNTTRGYAKGKDKKKSDKGKKSIHVSDDQLAEIINVETIKAQFQKQIDKLKDDYFKNLSLRSTTGSIETLQISLDGNDYTLQELAQIVRKDPKTVVINMAVFPQAIPAAIQALQKSGMNLNPQQDGTTLYIPIPKVTKEHRENLSKNAKVLFVKCRDSIKDVQNKFIKNVKNKEDISTDAAHDAQNHITSLANQYVTTAEKVLEAKQAELLSN